MNVTNVHVGFRLPVFGFMVQSTKLAVYKYVFGITGFFDYGIVSTDT